MQRTQFLAAHPRLPWLALGGLAATIARGMDISDAVREAQDYTWQALKYGFRPGMGQLIPDRMFWARDDGEDSAGAQAEAAPTGARH